jgi:hypothetical protein
LNDLLNKQIVKWENLYQQHLKNITKFKVGSNERRNAISLRILCEIAKTDLLKAKQDFINLKVE